MGRVYVEDFEICGAKPYEGGRMTFDSYERVYHRDGYRCVYCGKYLLLDFDSWQSIHTDHLVPSSKGGSDADDNMVTSCAVCNTLKGTFAPENDIETLGRRNYIQAMREHIQARRAQRMRAFFELVEQMNSRLPPIGEP